MSSSGEPRSGAVALVGRPNAGKSTLMNQFLREKVAIVSDKPQTTRHLMIGVLTAAEGQMVFFDTPGIHKPQHRMNRQMVRWALEGLSAADVICLLADASSPFGRGDAYLLDLVRQVRTPKVLALNKIDLVAKPRLLPLLERYAAALDLEALVPISALLGDGCDDLLSELWPLLPEGPPGYDPDEITIHSRRFLASERIREQLLMRLRDELPFSTAVVIDRWEPAAVLRIYATILVEKPGQKGIVIGKQGAGIKAIGIAAREELEAFLGTRVHLDLHVRVEPDWRENRRILTDLESARLSDPVY